MPILAKEPCLYPHDLLVDPSQVQVGEGPPGERQWWVVYTKSRQEKSLARGLLRQEIPFYLPQVGRDHLIRGRRVRAQIPVYPGYLFLFGSSEERAGSLTTNCVSRVLPVPGQEQFLRDLRQLERLIASGQSLTIESRLAPGQRVRIRTGPLAGLEGLIFQRRGADRLLVAVNYLQQGVSVEINDFMVEPI